MFTLSGKIVRLGGFPASGRGYSLSEAEAINAKGQVVGISNNQAFFWSSGHLRRLPPPPGLTAADAHAVNDRGQATGKADQASLSGIHSRALLWNPAGGVQQLGTLPGYTGQHRTGD